MSKTIWKISFLAMVLGLGSFLGCAGNDPTIQRFTVTFISHDSVTLTTLYVDSGRTIDRPFGDPSRPGWTFTNWYNQETGGSIFNFDTPITANTTI